MKSHFWVVEKRRAGKRYPWISVYTFLNRDRARFVAQYHNDHDEHYYYRVSKYSRIGRG